MKSKETDAKDAQADVVDFWDHFQFLPWKWADEITSHHRYLVVSTLMAYAVFVHFTLFPDGEALPLKDYPSLNVIFLGGISIGVLMLGWRRKAPAIFKWLWQAERLESQGNNLGDEFRRYIQDYQKALLSKNLPLALGLLFISGLGIFLAQVPQFLAENYTIIPLLLISIAYLIFLFWAFMACIVGWAFLITSLYIQNLTKRFTIRIHPGHPDQCGGLRPLGDFCLKLATPLIAAGFVSAIISMSTWDNTQRAAELATVALFLLGPFAAITFFVPLWNIHNYMAQQKRIYEDTFSRQALELQQTIRTHTSETGNLKKAEIAKDKLEILQAVHPARLSYPVWPFRFTDTVFAIFSPQILQTVIGFGVFVYETFFKE